MNQEYLEYLEQQLTRLMERIVETETRQQSMNKIFNETNIRQGKLNHVLLDFMQNLAKHFDIKLSDLQDGLISPNEN